MGLKGAHVLITGEPLSSPPSKPPLTILAGCTRGVGEALVKYFLEQEAEVSYCAPTVTNAEFDEFHNSLPETNTARAVGTALDTLDKEAIENRSCIQHIESVGSMSLLPRVQSLPLHRRPSVSG